MSLEILKKYKIRAKKGLGQNFLVNQDVVKKIANTIDINGKNVVEVGPGYGALTEKLLEAKPKSLNLVELDQDMIEILNDRVSNGELGIENIDFKINKKDILKYEPGLLPSSILTKEGELKGVVYSYSVIANIPYYITSPILRHFLYDVKNKPEEMVILMQKEVAEKIMGNFKNRSSVLSLFIEKKSDVSYELDVSKEFFVPAPKIDSAVLLFKYNNKFEDIDDDKFMRIIKIGFREPRKKLINNLVKGGFKKENILEIFEEMGLGENVRGEALGVDEWCELVKRV